MDKKSTISGLKRNLSDKTKKQLVDEITNLYKRYDIVKEHYTLIIDKNDDSVLDKYKAIVKQEFLPSGEIGVPTLRLSVARKAITDYKKLSPSNVSVADIMLTYVEAGVECANCFGDLYESFYTSMESMYDRSLKYIVKEDVFDKFSERLENIINEAPEGWCFRDSLADLYSTCYEECREF